MIINGKFIFELYDVHGIPLSIIIGILKDKNLVFNVSEFICATLKQKWSFKKIRSILKEAHDDNHKINLELDNLVGVYIQYIYDKEKII